MSGAADPVCPRCLAFYRRETDSGCALHPEASKFWRNRRPLAGGQVIRIFAAGTLYTEVEVIECPPGVEEAYDLMTGDGMPPSMAASMAMAAHRLGRDPVASARHIIKLRGALRDA